jgi:tRNA1Val (adenine37-N6)-methyltransferase
MSNSYFRFKQFIIHQDRSAMKVCTDSCILGAWSNTHLHDARKILDIGSGTGLLLLMLAQNSVAEMYGIELDHESCKQAEENISESPWSSRIRVTEGDARLFDFPMTYDFIISNPPFFESDLQSPSDNKNNSKHETGLTLEELIKIIHSNLSDNGFFSVLLPFRRTDYFEKLAAATGLFLQEKLTVKQSPRHAPFRSICLFGCKKPANVITEDLVIKDEHGNNSKEYQTLMKDYYL